MIHCLRTWSEEYAATVSGVKQFEFRKNDRNFQVGDVLVLQEWNRELDDYTGEMLSRRVDYILPGGLHNVPDGYCVMSLSPLVSILAQLKEARDAAKFAQAWWRETGGSTGWFEAMKARDCQHWCDQAIAGLEGL